MTMEETTKVLALFGKNYTDFKKRMENKEEAKELISLWNECFKDLPYELVLSGVKKTLLISKYVPTIAEVRENCFSLVDKKEEAIDYWNEAYKMISNGSYMTEEQFEQHSEICKRYFGSLNRLREKSRTEDLNLEVEQSLFNKTAELMLQNKKQEKMIPNNIQFKLKEMIKQIGG